MGDKVKTEIKLKETVAAADVANRLEWIVEGLRAGTLSIVSDGETIKLTPGSVLDMKLKATQKKEKEKLEIEIEWRPSPFIAFVNE